jgi:hypothetical protein
MSAPINVTPPLRLQLNEKIRASADTPFATSKAAVG